MAVKKQTEKKPVNEKTTKRDVIKLCAALCVSLLFIIALSFFSSRAFEGIMEPPSYSESEIKAIVSSLDGMNIDIGIALRRDVEEFLGIARTEHIWFYRDADDAFTLWFVSDMESLPICFRNMKAHYMGKDYSLYLAKEEGGDEIRLRRMEDGEELAIPVK